MSSTSLITIVRQKFLDAIQGVNPSGRWKILVVDDFSQKLLGAVLKQFDILEQNVTLIENISNHREPQPAFEAMYLLMPTTQNVERIIRDFGDVPQYAGAHLFFTEGLAAHLLDQLANSPAFDHLRVLKEMSVNFSALEAQVFSLQAPEVFFSLYSPSRDEKDYTGPRNRLEEDLRLASRAISNVCISMNEFPFIRYYLPSSHPPLGPLKPHQSTRPPPPVDTSIRWRTNLARGAETRAYEAVEGDHATKLLAFMVQSHLEEYKKIDPDFAKIDSKRGRATLIITDRSMDMLAPFVHEFTYQAMAYDLLPIRDGSKYTYKFQSSAGAYEDVTSTLSDSDNVWTEVRHMHMRETIDKLMADFNKFLVDNSVFKGDGAADLNDMKDMLASLPQYQEQREKFSLHLNMAQECMSIFERDKLPLVANVEQSCATGLTAEGKTPKTLVEEMVPLLDSREVVNMNKVRLVALYIQHRDGVPDEDRRRLYQHARLTLAEQDAVNALTYLGVRISRAPSDKDTKKKIKQKPTDEEYDLSRFKPLIKTLIEDNVANKLDPILFPYVKESPSTAPPPASLRSQGAPSLRSQKPGWTRAAVRPTEIRQRLIVFVAGGLTYSEMREAYQLSSTLNKDIYIGSTHTITPRHLIDDLKVLDLAGVGSRAAPNGLRPPPPAQRNFQEFYDENYYTKDAPKPAPPPAPEPTKSKNSMLRSAPAQISPSNSYGSTTSGKEEKKKKKGLFRF